MHCHAFLDGKYYSIKQLIHSEDLSHTMSFFFLFRVLDSTKMTYLILRQTRTYMHSFKRLIHKLSSALSKLTIPHSLNFPRNTFSFIYSWACQLTSAALTSLYIKIEKKISIILEYSFPILCNS